MLAVTILARSVLRPLRHKSKFVAAVVFYQHQHVSPRFGRKNVKGHGGHAHLRFDLRQ